MRPDHEHVKKLHSALFIENGKIHVDIDVPHLSACMKRLSLWESGLLVESLMRAATAKRLSREQRVLLALFVHDKTEAGAADDPR